MKHATSRAIVFVLVIFALIVVINDIKSQRFENIQNEQVEVNQPDKSGLAVSQMEEE